MVDSKENDKFDLGVKVRKRIKKKHLHFLDQYACISHLKTTKMLFKLKLTHVENTRFKICSKGKINHKLHKIFYSLPVNNVVQCLDLKITAFIISSDFLLLLHL